MYLHQTSYCNTKKNPKDKGQKWKIKREPTDIKFSYISIEVTFIILK